MMRKYNWYLVVSDSIDTAITDEYEALTLFRQAVEDNEDCTMMKATYIKRLFRRPLYITELVMEYEKQ